MKKLILMMMCATFAGVFARAEGGDDSACWNFYPGGQKDSSTVATYPDGAEASKYCYPGGDYQTSQFNAAPTIDPTKDADGLVGTWKILLQTMASPKLKGYTLTISRSDTGDVSDVSFTADDGSSQNRSNQIKFTNGAAVIQGLNTNSSLSSLSYECRLMVNSSSQKKDGLICASMSASQEYPDFESFGKVSNEN